MVDGAHGSMDHVVRHVVVVEDIATLGCVIIPNLHVEENNVKAIGLLPLGVTILTHAVQVMSTKYVTSLFK